MSLIVEIVEFIDASSSLTADTDLFVGGEVVDVPSGSVIIRELPGSTENWSGMKERMIQVLALDLGYVNAETLIQTVHSLLCNKAGFATNITAFYCECASSPGILSRDERGNYIFSANYIVRAS